MAETIIDLHKTDRSWDRASEQRHRFKLKSHTAYLLEVQDVHFHLDSAVLLPDYQSGEPNPELLADERITGLAVLRACYLHAKENPKRKLLIAGHTDTLGRPQTNRRLSLLRAKNVLYALLGQRDEWVKISHQRHKVEDYQQILAWVARTWEWAQCDPGGIDNIAGPATRRALKSFQAGYNKEFKKSIAVDGVIGPQTWGAFFDLYMRELAAILETDEKGLLKLQGIIFVISDDAHKVVGCGENYPIEAPDQDEYYSAVNRRAEIIFFDPQEEPALTCPTDGTACEKDTCLIYKRGLYRFSHIRPKPVPRLVWLNLQTVDEWGYRMKSVGLKLEPAGGDPLTLTTDAAGYWHGRLNSAGLVRVTKSDGKSVRLGSSPYAESWTLAPGRPIETATIDPRVAAGTVTDIVVPAIPDDKRQKADELVRRHHRNVEDGRATMRSGPQDSTDAEKSAAVAARDSESPRYTRRWWGQYVADNLFLAAGWDSSGKYINLDHLIDVLTQWLRDCHPTALAQGFFVNLVVGRRLIICDSDKKVMGQFDLDENHAVIGAVGGYAWFEALGGDGQLFTDMATATRNLYAGEKTADSGSDAAADQDKGKPPEKEPAEGGEEVAKRSYLPQLLVENQQQRCAELILNLQAAGKTEITYQLPADLNEAIAYARHGGTGLLENYPADGELNGHVHQRNLAIVRTARSAFDAYLNYYISKVKEARDEKALHKLGPPESPFIFPTPVGATDGQQRDLWNAYNASSFKAWLAISDRLNEIWGIRGEGSLWVKVEFKANTGGVAGPFQAEVKWNFTVDDQGRFKADKVTQSAALEAKDKVFGKGVSGAVAVEDDGKGGKITKYKLKLGVYGVETDDSGGVKFSYKLAQSYTNYKTKVSGFGVELSTKDLLKSYWADRIKQTGEAMPDWVEQVPELKLGVGLFFQGLTEGTVLAFTSGAPGFFERRPLEELLDAGVRWVSLDWDEQKHLTELEWKEESWDGKRRMRLEQFPQSAQKDYYDLPAVQKIAAVHLFGAPHARDPYWRVMWRQLAAAAAPAGAVQT